MPWTRMKSVNRQVDRSLAKVIFAGVGVLLSDVRESQDTLVDIFERMEMFLLRRLEVYTQPTAELMDIIIQIVVEVNSILGIATREVRAQIGSQESNKKAGLIHPRKTRSQRVQYEEKKQYHAKTDVFEDQHAVLVSTWTHVARRRSDAKVG
ncbi:hypothetical protein F5888DRAFT_1887571 [Russula emetica]|nr:hypothetical protein F5888DRAFT_1887571 [Russula emetica]